MVCLLRIAFIFYTLVGSVLNPHSYCSIYSIAIHFFQILAMISQIILLKFLRYMHITAQFIILVANCFWIFIIFWPTLYYKLLMDPNGRSIFTILMNPKNCKLETNSKSPTNIQQKKVNKTAKTLRFYNRSHMLLSEPSSQGAYARVDEPNRELLLDSMQKDLFYKQIYVDDPLRLMQPYEFMAKRQVKPPDGMLLDVIAFLAVALTFLWP